MYFIDCLYGGDYIPVFATPDFSTVVIFPYSFFSVHPVKSYRLRFNYSILFDSQFDAKCCS